MKAILYNNYLRCFAVTIFLAFLFLSFKSNDTQTTQSNIQYKEIDFSIEQVNKSDEKLKYKFISDGIDIELAIDLKTEACLLTVNGKNVLTDFNYFYDTDLQSAIEEIKILKKSNGNDIVILIPTFTEEFLSFQLIKFESSTHLFKNGFFEINTHEYKNVRNFYLDNEVFLTQVKDSFEISLSDFKYKGVFKNFKN